MTTAQQMVRAARRNLIQIGQIVLARDPLYSDGSVPGVPDGECIAAPGTRGVVMNVGHLEADPSQSIVLVRFDGPDGGLGPPVGCYPQELDVPADEGER